MMGLWVGWRQRGQSLWSACRLLAPLWADGAVAGFFSVLLRRGEDQEEAIQSLSTLIRTQRHTHPALGSVPTGLCCGVCVDSLILPLFTVKPHLLCCP